ncbi:MAG TPA: hydrogenase maturation nickel metallochaperone HypA [Gemmataceae bacterium]|nr:hydrogenase maturation nickel metallochaperone HypA [Gemmataceae bacterium]
MHELSIALNMIDVVTEEAAKHGGSCVKAIHLKLGPLSGVVKEALVGAFELARADSPLAATELVIEEMPILIRCPRCQGPRAIVSLYELACIECGTASAEVTQGRELEVTALEIE